MKRVMYVECKGGELDGAGRIAWVELSRSRRAYHYRGRLLHKVAGYRNNCVDAETGERYWISEPNKNGEDKLYGGVVEIDEEYWLKFGACLSASINFHIEGNTRMNPLTLQKSHTQAIDADVMSTIGRDKGYVEEKSTRGYPCICGRNRSSALSCAIHCLSPPVAQSDRPSEELSIV